MKKTVFITGSEGYIGKVLVGHFLRAGWQVRGCDTDYYADGYLYPDPGQNYTLLRKDVRHIVPDDLSGVSAVVALAALSNDPMGELDPGLTESINLDATVRLGEMAKTAGAERFVFSSSCSIYGISDKPATTEDDALSPLTAYARSKAQAEERLARLAAPSFTPCFMRNATVYGISPKLRMDLVVNNLVGAALATGRITILSDGTPWRPLVHVDDLSQAFVLFASCPPERVRGKAFNVGIADGNYQVKDLARMINEVLPECRVEIKNETGRDTRSYRVSFARFLAAFPEFRPQWTMERGIRQIIGAYRRHGLVTPAEFESRKYTRLKQMRHLIDHALVDNFLFWRDPGKGMDVA